MKFMVYWSECGDFETTCTHWIFFPIIEKNLEVFKLTEEEITQDSAEPEKFKWKTGVY